MDELSKGKHLKDRQNIKIFAVAYKGGSCFNCGGVFHPCVFDFHHEGEKKMTIGRMLHYGFNYIKDELDSCIMLCANCHRLVHFSKEAP